MESKKKITNIISKNYIEQTNILREMSKTDKTQFSLIFVLTGCIFFIMKYLLLQ
jgi:preprotein translocase subunit Sss1